MGSAILITGVAGSGKSAACEELKRRGFTAYDIENTVGLFSFINKFTRRQANDTGDDNPEWFERNSWICDRKKLTKLVRSNDQGTAFYCGIASNLDDLLPLFDKVFLLRARPSTIRERLSGRPADDFGYGPAVQEWLLGWKDGWERWMIQKGALVVDADRTIAEVADEVITKVSERSGAG